MKFPKIIIVAALALLASISAMAAASAKLTFAGGPGSGVTGISFEVPSWLGKLASEFDPGAMQTGAKLKVSGKADVSYTQVLQNTRGNVSFKAAGPGSFNSGASAFDTSLQMDEQGVLNFGFQSGEKDAFDKNGSPAIGVILAKDGQSALILLNDSISKARNKATDDVGFGDDAIKVVITPVPEPETYAMLLAGLALVGAVARRRQVKAKG